MLQLARKLSDGYPHVRVDFYLVNEEVYYGELTLYPGSGYDKVFPEALERQMSSWLILPEKSEG